MHANKSDALQFESKEAVTERPVAAEDEKRRVARAHLRQIFSAESRKVLHLLDIYSHVHCI
jgi:hypothetical protein